MNKKIPLLIITILIATSIRADMGLGVAIKASTMGFGGDVALGLNKNMDVRLGFDMMGFSYDFTFEETGINYSAIAAVKTGSITALFDYYIGNSIFIAAGAGYNMFNTNVSGHSTGGFPYGDITITDEKIGDFKFGISPGLKISPYLGIGFGRALGSEKNFSVAFEIGTYYQGKPDINIESTGLLAPTSDPDLGQELYLEHQINQYYLYPVLKLSLSYRLFKF
jgi:hypothetical protein